MNKKSAVAALPSLFFVLAWGAVFLAGCERVPETTDSGQAGPGTTQEAPAKTAVLAPASAGIRIFFKLDPRLTRSLYMGDRWVSPPTYTGAGAQDTVEARVYGVDAQGKIVAIHPEWTASDPEIVVIAPNPGAAVRITVKHPGQSKVTVSALGFSKDLRIQAKPVGNALQVEISQ